MSGSALRHLVSINDLKIDEIETVFSLADHFLKDLGDPNFSHRLASSTDIGQGRILATLFYEPSTRTRLSFESAMLRLGGKSVSSADPATSSAAKGESLADTVRVAQNYADVLVLRHPRDGAARLAAEYANVPIINGGDGGHEHPTQTLCDLYTLRKENKNLRKMSVALSGDLRGSRTIHSFVYALARFGATIVPMPAKGMELPEHVDWRLRYEFNCVSPKSADPEQLDAFYMTSDKPHQLALIAENEQLAKLKKNIDAVYITRFQKERWADKDQDYPKIDAKFLKQKQYSKSSLLHPLPRVGELDVSLDSDKRAAYFRQAAYGVPIRMALMALVLGLDRKRKLDRFENGFRDGIYALYAQPVDTGIRCTNKNCIVHDAMEQPYVRNKFHLVDAHDLRLRCFYCETDIESFVVAHKKTKHYEEPTGDLRADLEKRGGDIVFFGNADAAEAASYTKKRPVKQAAKA